MLFFIIIIIRIETNSLKQNHKGTFPKEESLARACSGSVAILTSDQTLINYSSLLTLSGALIVFLFNLI